MNSNESQKQIHITAASIRGMIKVYDKDELAELRRMLLKLASESKQKLKGEK